MVERLKTGKLWGSPDSLKTGTLCLWGCCSGEDRSSWCIGLRQRRVSLRSKQVSRRARQRDDQLLLLSACNPQESILDAAEHTLERGSDVRFATMPCIFVILMVELCSSRHSELLLPAIGRRRCRCIGGEQVKATWRWGSALMPFRNSGDGFNSKDSSFCLLKLILAIPDQLSTDQKW